MAEEPSSTVRPVTDDLRADPRWSDETRADLPLIAEATPFEEPPMTAPVTWPDAPAPPVDLRDATVQQPVVHAAASDVRTRRVSPSSIVAGIAATLLMVTGAVAMARAGLDRPLDRPVVTVAGYPGTAVVGIVLLVAGFVLLLAAVTRSRPVIVVVGVLLVVAALTVVIEPTVGGDIIATDRDAGIALLIVSGLVTLVALVAPDVRRTRSVTVG